VGVTLTIREAAVELDLSEDEVLERIAAGKLPVTKVAGRKVRTLRVDARELAKFKEKGPR
jgi:excisionase family DNA binding protein